MHLLYFAWVRERAGIGEEEIVLPADVRTVAALLSHLQARGGRVAGALAETARIRVAVNQEHVTFDHPVGSGDEVAFFPPVTGG